MSVVAMAGVVGLAAGSVLVAPASQAAETHEVTLTCQGETTIYGAVGDTFIFTMADTCGTEWELFNTMNYFSSGGPAPGLLDYVTSVNGTYVGPRVDWAVYSDGSGTTQVTTTLLAASLDDPSTASLAIGNRVAEVDNDGLPPDYFPSQIHAIIYGGLTPPSSSSGGSQTPPPVHQAVGMPASGSCADVDDRDLNWGGAAAGGWTSSWQQWVNAGTGGAVCQRVLRYAGNGTWAVQP
jgi:hypothetical protein